MTDFDISCSKFKVQPSTLYYLVPFKSILILLPIDLYEKTHGKYIICKKKKTDEVLQYVTS